MDKVTVLNQRNPVALAREFVHRLKRLRLAKSWIQEVLSARSGVAVSTLKLLEAKGNGPFQRLVRVAVALGADGEFRGLFSNPAMESIAAVKLSERQRAPRHRKKGGDGGA